MEYCRVKTKSAKFPNTDALLTSTTAASANTPPPGVNAFLQVSGDEQPIVV